MNLRRGLVVSTCAGFAALAALPAGQMPEARSHLEQLRDALPSASITAVRIVGNLRWVSRSELARAVAGPLRGGFFRVDVDAVRRAALGVAWVRDVSVRRVWPGELHLTVVEDRPIARWAGGGFLSDRDVLLPPRRGVPAEGLPVFDGSLRTIPALRARLREFGSILDGIGGGIERLERSAAGNWTLGFADGVRLVFRDGQERQVRRFAAVYEAALEGRRRSIDRIDLRYPNGFAVQWRNGRDAHSRARG